MFGGGVIKKFTNVWGDLKNGRMSIGTGYNQTLTANTTLNAADSGAYTFIGADALTITVPAYNANIAACVFNIVNGMGDGQGNVTIAPTVNDKIMGCGLSAADNKYIQNTKATSKKGDMVSLQASVDGYYILKMVGTWARQA